MDELAVKKFTDLGLKPSPLCDDATFIRRAFLDAIGSLPTPEEIAAFLQSTAPNKREQLVDSLLGLTGDPARDLYNDRYSAYWTLRWSDLIRNNSKLAWSSRHVGHAQLDSPVVPREQTVQPVCQGTGHRQRFHLFPMDQPISIAFTVTRPHDGSDVNVIPRCAFGVRQVPSTSV